MARLLGTNPRLRRLMLIEVLQDPCGGSSRYNLL
ncbi:hypothetical protein NC651_007302 [Populus alba x Populus x berolinensis]|nr:hypothetical protein NC651_007302 [Populus alba x Populus x berolinensis]